MKKAPKTELVDGVTFELRPVVRFPTNPDWVCLRKPPKFVKRYRELAREFQGCRMMEVGVDQGGGTSFFTKLFKPQGLLAIELSKDPVGTLMDFLQEHDKEQRVQVCWGVDQADRVKIPQLVDDMFDHHALDFIVDDASHLLAPSTSTFEMLFPRLRQGGVYVIEDWSSDHLVEGRIASELATNPDGQLARDLLAGPKVEPEKPLSFLICQFIIASARNPEWIPAVRVFNGYCEIRRGIANIEPGTPISDYVGDLGNWMLSGDS